MTSELIGTLGSNKDTSNGLKVTGLSFEWAEIFHRCNALMNLVQSNLLWQQLIAQLNLFTFGFLCQHTNSRTNCCCGSWKFDTGYVLQLESKQASRCAAAQSRVSKIQ